MSSYRKTMVAAVLGSLLFLTACSSPQTAPESLPEPAPPEAPVVEVAPEPAPPEEPVIQVPTLLIISQVWQGNSVSLSLLDSEGKSCDAEVQSEECQGFYIGWQTNFSDDNRTVEYDFRETKISDLEVGDEGVFLLMYQEASGGEGPPVVVKEFPFSYTY